MALTAMYYRELCLDLQSHPQSAPLIWESSLKFRWINERVEIHVLNMVLEYGMEYVGHPVRMIAYANAKETALMLAKALKHHVTGIIVDPSGQDWVSSISVLSGFFYKLAKIDSIHRCIRIRFSMLNNDK